MKRNNKEPVELEDEYDPTRPIWRLGPRREQQKRTEANVPRQRVNRGWGTLRGIAGKKRGGTASQSRNERYVSA